MDELKPCPWCGRVPEEPRHFANQITPVYKKRYGIDHGCGNVVTTVFGDSPEEVIERWNRRAEHD